MDVSIQAQARQRNRNLASKLWPNARPVFFQCSRPSLGFQQDIVSGLTHDLRLGRWEIKQESAARLAARSLSSEVKLLPELLLSTRPNKQQSEIPAFSGAQQHAVTDTTNIP